jgi:hypothetical protein
VIADFADKPSLGRAPEGVDAVDLVCSPVRELVELEGNMVDACRAAGAPCGSELCAASRRLCEVLPKLATQSGRQAPRIWPRLYSSAAEQLHAEHPDILRTQHQDPGSILCRDGECSTSFIDVRDVASVAARTLTSPGRAGKTYELNGPEAVTYGEVAEKITLTIGRKVQSVNIPVTQQKQATLDQRLPDWLITALLDLQVYYTSDKSSEVDDVVSTILGRAPRTMDQLLADLAGSFVAKTGAA